MLPTTPSVLPLSPSPNGGVAGAGSGTSGLSTCGLSRRFFCSAAEAGVAGRLIAVSSRRETIRRVVLAAGATRRPKARTATRGLRYIMVLFLERAAWGNARMTAVYDRGLLN